MPTLKKVSKSGFFYQFGVETVPEAFRTGPDRTGPPPIFKKAHPVGVLEDSYPCRNEKAGPKAGSCWRVFQFFTTEPLR